MKKNILLILSLLFSSLAYSQHYEMLGSDRQDHLNNFSESSGFNLLDSNKNYIKFAYVYEDDTTMHLTCYFTSTEWRNDCCTKVLYEFFCNKCAEDNIASIANKKGEWIESESNYYVSKKRPSFDISFAKDRESDVKTMRVTNTPNQKVKTTILFKMETMRTKIWKELVK